MSETKKEHQFVSLTGMRGIACIFIVFYLYYCVYFGNLGIGPQALPFFPQSHIIFEYSKNAVELCFMISGFLTAYHYRDKIATLAPLDYVKKRYGKLISPSIIVNLWALINVLLILGNVPGSAEWVSPVTPLRTVLSILMINTGWFTSYPQTDLPINSTMWFIDVLLLCYLLYYLIRKLAKNQFAYRCACVAMVLVGWICLEHSPQLPFLWPIDGRGYAPFFIGALLCEFQTSAREEVKERVSLVWGALILGFFVVRLFIGFENVFGPIGGFAYVRYFEFIAAPGLLLVALNLRPITGLLSWKGFVWLGALSGAIYYVTNCLLEDYFLLNAVTGSTINFSSGLVFIAVVVSVIPFALLWQLAENKLKAARSTAA